MSANEVLVELSKVARANMAHFHSGPRLRRPGGGCRQADASGSMNFWGSSSSTCDVVLSLLAIGRPWRIPQAPCRQGRQAAPSFWDWRGPPSAQCSVQLAFDNLPASLEHIRSGKLHPLAITMATRSDALPRYPGSG